MPGRAFASLKGGAVFARRHHTIDMHPVLRERSGFVRANICHRSKCFHCGQATDQRVLLDHARCAQCKRNGDNSRQGFRNRGNRQADGGQQHDQWLLAAQQAGDKNDGANGQYDECEILPKTHQAFLQRRFTHFARQQRSDLSQFGAHAGGHHQSVATTIGDHGALVGQVQAVAQRQIGRIQLCHPFVDHLGFAGQRRFIDLER